MHENFKKDTKSIDKDYIISKPEKEVGMIIRKTLLIQQELQKEKEKEKS